MRDPMIRWVAQPPPADTAGTDTPWLPWSMLALVSQAGGTDTQTAQAHCSHGAARMCSKHQVATPCLGDRKASMVSAVTIPTIPPTQGGDPKLRLLQTISDQHCPGQHAYMQIYQPAATECTCRSYTFPHK